MQNHSPVVTRRNVLCGAVAAVGIAGANRIPLSSAAFAEQLALTPAVEEGPFYPHKMPLDTDNDLIIINNSLTEAVGQVTHLGGRVLDASGSPINNAVVEIWQCDVNGVYIASGGDNREDRNFQGYGRFLTSSTGEYYFRTIKPVPYGGRPAPHVHIKISKGRSRLLTTQLFVRGFAGNRHDHVYLGIGNPADRELASTDFKPIQGSQIGEVSALFDVVVGRTPADAEDGGH